MPIKFLVLGGVVVFSEGRGGSANFIFMGVGIGPTNGMSPMHCQHSWKPPNSGKHGRGGFRIVLPSILLRPFLFLEAPSSAVGFGSLIFKRV